MNGLVGINRRALIKVFIKVLGMVRGEVSHLLPFHIDYFYNLPFVNLQAEPFFGGTINCCVIRLLLFLLL